MMGRLTLILDPCRARTLLLGFKERSLLHAKRIALPSDKQQTVFAYAEAYLHTYKLSLLDVKSVIVVNGPGRFSGLRMAAVMANIFAWDKGSQLFTARSRKEQSSDPAIAAWDILQRSRPVRRIAPYYGKPAHITRPKRR